MAPVSRISQPLQLDDDYTPFPLPKFDPVSGLEPTFVRGSVDGEAVLVRMKQQQQQRKNNAETTAMLDESVVNDIVGALDAATSAAAREAAAAAAGGDPATTGSMTSNRQRMEKELRSASSGHQQLPPPRYLREPTSLDPCADRVIERQFCLRQIPELIQQLADDDAPNFERNVAALSDIHGVLEGYLNEAVLCAGGDTTHLAFKNSNNSDAAERRDDDEDEHTQALRLVRSYKSVRDANIHRDFAAACEAVKSMFEGASRALFMAKFEHMKEATGKAFRQDTASQQVFFDFFYMCERFVVEAVVPELCQVATSLSAQGTGVTHQQQQFIRILLCAVTEYMGIVAHYQTLDHRRHFDRDEYHTSGRLRPVPHATTVGRVTDATGNRCFAALASELHVFSALVPTATLAQWLLLFGSSFERLVSDMQTHAELKQKLTEELVLNRLLPACKAASRLREQSPSALFEDNDIFGDDAHDDAPSSPAASPSSSGLFAEVANGRERGRIIGDILLGCAMCDVTLPREFLVEALIQPALKLCNDDADFSSSMSSASPPLPPPPPFLQPNFFSAMARLLSGDRLPDKVLLPLAAKQFQRFLAAAPSGEGGARTFDWINCTFDLAFSTHNRDAAIRFLRDDARLNQALLGHMCSFGYDLQAQQIEDDTENTMELNGGLPPEMTARALHRLRASAKSPSLAAGAESKSAELFVPPEGGSVELLNLSREAQLQIAEDKKREFHDLMSCLPTLLGPHRVQGAAAAVPSSFFDTNACHKIATSRTAYILHPSLFRGPTLDSLRQIIERCREQSSCLVVLSSCFFHLAETTADTASRCGRRAHRGTKRRAVRAILEELKSNTKTVFVTPEEEVALRFHDGFAHCDSMVWELRGWIASRAPTTRVIVACSEDSRVRYRFQIFRRNGLATEQLDPSQQGGEGLEEDCTAPYSAPASSASHMLLHSASAVRSSAEPLLDLASGNAESDVHAPRLVPGTARHGVLDTRPTGLLDSIQERYVTGDGRRIRDPVSRKFQPGLWVSGNKSEKTMQQCKDWSNVLPTDSTSASVGRIRRLAMGRSRGAVMEDLRELGIMTPDHAQ